MALDPDQLRKARREVDGFRRFQALSAELVQVNERICQLRPVQAQDRAEPVGEAKKKRCGRSKTPSAPRSGNSSA